MQIIQNNQLEWLLQNTLPFSFGENVGFINYCRQALNPVARRVPRATLTETLETIYDKEKRKLEK